MNYELNPKLYDDDVAQEPIRKGFGVGLKKLGASNPKVVALSADLTESTQMHLFAEEFPERFIEVGIGEQNLVTLSSGLAHMGYIPYCSSYAAFSPGRNFEQIRTTIALNNQPVKIVGSHAGVSVGPDGATHQSLEDIALMRVLPNMVVIAPGDSIEARKATIAMAENSQPNYIRLAREKAPIFSTENSPFEIGKAYKLRDGNDVAIVTTGSMTYHALIAAKELESRGISAEIVHVPTIKPLDESTILASAQKCGRIVTCEEAQIAGGFGGAVAELLCEKLPTPLKRIGVPDKFGQSGTPSELLEFFGLTGSQIADTVKNFVENIPKYHEGL